MKPGEPQNLLRYGRQMRVPGIGAAGQTRIAQLRPTLRADPGLARSVESAYLVAAGSLPPSDDTVPASAHAPRQDVQALVAGWPEGPSAVLEGAWLALSALRAAALEETP
jgi:hypothetical protein